MKIYFIRHGETDMNKNKIIQGQEIDAPLNDTGRKQAEELASELSIDFDLVFSSPLKRAVETAEIINARYNRPIIIKHELAERSYGSFSGNGWDYVKEQVDWNVDELGSYARHYVDYTPWGGESMEEVVNRINNFLGFVRDKHNRNTPLVVSHAGIIRFVHRILRDKEVDRVHNASVHEFNI